MNDKHIPGSIQLDTSLISISEGISKVDVTLLRVEGSDGVASVSYSTVNATALDGKDYLGQTGRLVFEDGQTSATITIPILDDSLVEGEETFNIAIGESEGAELGVPRTAIITIEDDDVSEDSTIGFSQSTFSVNENSDVANVEITREGLINTKVTVDLTTVDDYANSSSINYPDYQAVSKTLTFLPGETSLTVTIPILNDNLPENDESLTLSLSNPVGINLGVQSTSELTIIDDDIASDFSQETLLNVNDGAVRWVSFDWINQDKILIADLEGIVYVYDESTGRVSDTPFLDIRESVNVFQQRGLISLAVDPDFPNNPYVYLGFAYDSPEDIARVGEDQAGRRDTRLIRVTADPRTDYTTVIPNSEVVLMSVPESGSFHASAGIRFGNDGSLFYAHGDGAQVGVAISNNQDFERLDYPFGKLYRINPNSGEGYEDNPFYTGDVNDIESKVYSYGLRNPFRIAIHPITGEPFIGDVGWTNWEEINTGRGENFGWPYFEGGNGNSLRTAAYADDPQFQPFYDSNPDVEPPLYARNHDEGFAAIILGDFYTGETYPALYENALFFGELTTGNLEALLFDDKGNVETSVFFGNLERISQLVTGPDGNLYGIQTGYANGANNSASKSLVKWVYEPDSPVDSSGVLKIGTSGNDTLEGLPGDDTLRGNDGDDLLDGQEGDDLVFGGRGDDRLFVREGNDRAWAGAGDDTLRGNDGDDILQGQEGDDLVFGGRGDDKLFGENGRDVFWGGVGDDTVRGGDGIDILNGQEGNDVLDGGGGRDRLSSGSGDDRLIGGTDSDNFIFDGVFETIGRDIISDFEDVDFIRLSKSTFGLTGAVGDSIHSSDFAKGVSGSIDILSAKVVYNTTIGRLFYNANGIAPGFGSGGRFIDFENNFDLTISDIKIIS